MESRRHPHCSARCVRSCGAGTTAARRRRRTWAGCGATSIRYHGRRHPREMGEREVAAFLTWLATDLRVCASTQNQALAALRFLYRDVLGMPFATGDAAGGAARAKPSQRVPVVLGRAEVRR